MATGIKEPWFTNKTGYFTQIINIMKWWERLPFENYNVQAYYSLLD